MTTTHEPADTRLWSTAELSDLIGKYVTVTSAGGQIAGVVENAFVDRHGMPSVDFTSGAQIHWDRDRDEVRIEVHESDREEDW